MRNEAQGAWMANGGQKAATSARRQKHSPVPDAPNQGRAGGATPEDNGSDQPASPPSGAAGGEIDERARRIAELRRLRGEPWVKRLVDQAPPLTPERRAKLAVLTGAKHRIDSTGRNDDRASQ